MLSGASETPLGEELKALLLAKLEETAAKCEKKSANVYDQERHFSISYLPNVEEDRAKARGAYNSIHGHIESERTVEGMVGYFTADLAEQKGLFYQIFRGKVNKYVVPQLPEAVREKATFKY